MPAPNVEIVLVVDSSQSMKNCFDQLRRHFNALTSPLQGHVFKTRFGLVALSAFKGKSGPSYRVGFVRGPWDGRLYGPEFSDTGTRDDFFTDKPADIDAALAGVVPKGNEDMLLALDIAADLPFGPLSNTKRVIALFSDERFERGVSSSENHHLIRALREKLMARHIQLFAAIPEGPAANELAETDRSEVDFIDGGEGLKNVDFSQLLAQMGKSISGSMIQAVSEPTYQRAIFGQDRWVPGEDGFYHPVRGVSELSDSTSKVPATSSLFRSASEIERDVTTTPRKLPSNVGNASDQVRSVGEVFRDHLMAPEMVALPKGRFLMGSDLDLSKMYLSHEGHSEGPPHIVTIAYNLALSRFPITFEEWDEYASDCGLKNTLDHGWGRGRRPVIGVSWDDAKAYIAWLNERLGFSADDRHRYRLSTEAEWEFACRAGTTSHFSCGEKISADNANFRADKYGGSFCAQVGIYRMKTTIVSAFPPNNWGLYDMHGNVYEWVEDGYENSYHGAPNDGQAFGNGLKQKVIRGGSFGDPACSLRSASRFPKDNWAHHEYIGFRIARTLP